MTAVPPLAELADAVTVAVARLSEEPALSENGKDEMSLENEYATIGAATTGRDEPSGEPSPYSCG